MVEWLWGFFVPIALWIVDKAFGGHVRSWLEAGLRRRLPLQRVILPLDRKAFRESQDVLKSHFPERLQYPPHLLQSWLEEGDTGGPWMNLYFVARDSDHQARGVLFATVYQGEPNRTMVAYFVVDPSLKPRDAVASRLWKALLEAAEDFLKTDRCEYYFVFMSDGSEGEDENRHRRDHRHLLRTIGAKAFQLELTVPDLSKADQTADLVKDNIFLDAGLAFKGRGTADVPDLAGALHMTYELEYWWALTWATEDMGESRKIANYLDELRRVVETRIGGSSQPLLVSLS